MSKVMIVEDEPIVSEHLSEILEDYGFDVVGVFDEAEAAVKESILLKPDVILMDIKLKKKMTGIEAAEHIYRKQKIPSIYLTAYGDEETLKKVTQSGPFGYVLKPFQDRELRAAIDIALHRSGTERKLEVTRFNFEDIVAKIHDGIVIVDPLREIRYSNQMAKKLLNENFDLLTQKIFEEKKGGINIHELSIEEGNGQSRSLEISMGPYEWQGEQVKLVTLRDVTVRVEAEKKLKIAQENFERMINRNADAMMVLDKKGVVLFLNPSAERIFERSRSELLGKQFGYSVQDGKSNEIQVIQKNGQMAIGEIRTVTTEWEGEPCLLASIRDVTKQKEIQDQLLQSQKMETIGLLAGGVAHDFNNLLTAMRGYAELTQERVDAKDPFYGFLTEVLNASDRASGLTHQLLAFSRREMSVSRTFNLNELVENMKKMLNRLIGEDISMESNLNESLWPITADPGQIEQVILNLCVNARDAMPEGGVILLKTQNIDFSSKSKPKGLDLKEDFYVQLSVQDSGTGIPKDTLPSIFKPFFTTKEEGRGTGLGLSTCLNIIKSTRGDIDVQSSSEGTTFNIYVPRAATKDTQLLDHQSEEKVPKGNETILYVEDERALRDLFKQRLESLGYEVLVAKDGPSALKTIKALPENQVHLLLTDIVMPGMSGRELAQEIQKISPKSRVLFTSGYLDDKASRDKDSQFVMEFIAKPYRLQTLAIKVRKVLDKKN